MRSQQLIHVNGTADWKMADQEQNMSLDHPRTNQTEL
jgi:hypothetical protein